MLGNHAQHVRRSLVTAAFLVLAACGVGSTTTPVYVEGVIGPGGGTLETENLRLVIPPGAFDEEKVCAIVPGPDDLPIDPAEGEIDLLPGCMCLGPRGDTLAVPGNMRFCYDPSDIPSKVSEDDLVLLEFDETLGYLVVTPANHDTTTHCFEDVAYDQLGYVVVGARIGDPPPPPPDFDFTLFGSTFSPLVAPQGLPQNTGLILCDTDPLGLPPQVLAGTGNAFDYLGSFDGSRLLYTVPDFQQESTSLRTVDTAPPNDDREVLPANTFNSQDPYFGWLGEFDLVYHAFNDGSFSKIEPQGTGPTAHFAVKAGDGTGIVQDVITKQNFFTFLDDVRISPDRQKVMLRWIVFGKGAFYTCDIFALDESFLIENVAQSFADGRRSPRWMPDSSGVYYVENDGITVTELALRPNDFNFPEGFESLTLYTMNVVNSELRDFVVAPNFGPLPEDQRCAFIRRDLGIIEQAFGDDTGPDSYDTDTLAGTDHTSLGLGDFVFVEEMVPAFSVGSFQTSVVLVQMDIESRALTEQAVLPSDPNQHTLVFDLASTFLWADIPAPISDIDLSRAVGFGGQVLAWIQQTDAAYPEYPTPGVYHLDSFFGNPVNVTPPGFTVLGPPRWLESWRNAPGHDAFNPRVR